MMTRSTGRRSTSGPEVRVSDLRQWYYCPRIIYWRYTFRAPWKPGKITKVDERHDPSWVGRLKAFSGCKVERNVCLRSSSLNLVGCMDALITCGDELIPLEMKRGALRDGHDVQLCAYAMLIEENFGVRVTRGYLYYPGEKLEEVPMDDSLRRKVLRTLNQIRKTLEEGRMPEPTKDRWKCRVCDHYTYCGGV